MTECNLPATGLFQITAMQLSHSRHSTAVKEASKQNKPI